MSGLGEIVSGWGYNSLRKAFEETNLIGINSLIESNLGGIYFDKDHCLYKLNNKKKIYLTKEELNQLDKWDTFDCRYSRDTPRVKTTRA